MITLVLTKQIESMRIGIVSEMRLRLRKSTEQAAERRKINISVARNAGDGDSGVGYAKSQMKIAAKSNKIYAFSARCSGCSSSFAGRLVYWRKNYF